MVIDVALNDAPSLAAMVNCVPEPMALMSSWLDAGVMVDPGSTMRMPTFKEADETTLSVHVVAETHVCAAPVPKVEAPVAADTEDSAITFEA